MVVRVMGILLVEEFVVAEVPDDVEHMDVCAIALPISVALGMSGLA